MSEKWGFDFSLNPHINCDDSLPQINRIELKVDTQKPQHKITGFSIIIDNTTKEGGTNEALLMARRLTDLLVSTSGTFSRYILSGNRKINPNGSATVSKFVTFGYSIVDNANLNIDPNRLNGILEGNDSEINEKMNLIYHATNSLNARDYISTIRFLDLACNEAPQGDLEKFHYLRHALSHNKDPLTQNTITKIKNGFGNDYFDFTPEDKFDFASSKTLKNLQTQAQEFHNRIRNDLNNDF